MKARSNALCAYLKQTGALNGTPGVLALAKKQYRSLYKKQWKKQRQSHKEVRIGFTIEQYQMVTNAAMECGQKPTVYARNSILGAVANRPFIVEKEILLHILQLLSMAINTVQNHSSQQRTSAALLEQAEQLLLTYIHKYKDEKRTPATF